MGSQDEKILANLRKGAVEFCLLAMLRDGEAYGLDISRRMTELGLMAGEGTVYPLLSRLRQGGLVITRLDDTESNRPRRYYSLTESGRGSLRVFSQLWGPFSTAVTEIVKEK